ncbi:hypothetical protein B0H14DRAFT_2567360 [Mycena olivaceomarginata]|nr:hypothetical protein B0H14DRAFT_2567360 [Mycena olivaceomarginata]
MSKFTDGEEKVRFMRSNAHLLHMTDPSFSGDIIQAVIASGVSELFPHLLRHSSSALVDAGIIAELVVLATRSGPLQQEAMWTMCNVLGRSLDPHQMESLVQLGCIRAMYEAALGNDISLARVCLATFLEIKRRWNVHFGCTPQSWLPAAEIVVGFIAHEDEQIASIAFDLRSTLEPVIPPFMSRKEYTQPEPKQGLNGECIADGSLMANVVKVEEPEGVYSTPCEEAPANPAHAVRVLVGTLRV